MTRRSISTNAPIVSCDVCGRTLLPGEYVETFLAGGAKRNVCELCTQRAANEGWIPEGRDDAAARAGAYNGRSRGFLARLLQRRPEHHADHAPHDDHGHHEPEPAHQPMTRPEPRHVHAVPTNADLKMGRALDLFNASSHPRTVAGVARSLGPPIVAVRPSPTEGSVVTIVVGWELSWYRYEVDLADEAAGVRVAAQGSELSELEAADQIANASADEHGDLHLVAQHA